MNLKKKKRGRKNTTELQKKAVDNILSGKYESKADAMKDAGYSPVTASYPKQNLTIRQGVQKYIAKLDKQSKKKHGKSIAERVMNVYDGGLEAKTDKGFTDHNTRKKFADQFAEFFGWKQQQIVPSQMNQYNFFDVPEEQKNEFNKNLKRFLRSKKK